MQYKLVKIQLMCYIGLAIIIDNHCNYHSYGLLNILPSFQGTKLWFAKKCGNIRSIK